MANYKERRAEIWILQVRTKGTNTAWCATSRGFFHSRKDVLKYIETEVMEQNFKYLEYRPMRYIPLATKDSQQRHAYRIAEVATDQIKSALKENERLRGLLERACIVLSSGIVGMPEEVRREARMVVREYIKAAVTGASHEA